MDPVANILGQKSIRQAILEILSDKMPHTFDEIKGYVSQFYHHRKGLGQQFLSERTGEELYRLQHYDKIIIKPKYGWYKLK